MEVGERTSRTNFARRSESLWTPGLNYISLLPHSISSPTIIIRYTLPLHTDMALDLTPSQIMHCFFLSQIWTSCLTLQARKFIWSKIWSSVSFELLLYISALWHPKFSVNSQQELVRVRYLVFIAVHFHTWHYLIMT